MSVVASLSSFSNVMKVKPTGICVPTHSIAMIKFQIPKLSIVDKSENSFGTESHKPRKNHVTVINLICKCSIINNIPKSKLGGGKESPENKILKMFIQP